MYILYTTNHFKQHKNKQSFKQIYISKNFESKHSFFVGFISEEKTC